MEQALQSSKQQAREADEAAAELRAQVARLTQREGGQAQEVAKERQGAATASADLEARMSLAEAALAKREADLEAAQTDARRAQAMTDELLSSADETTVLVQQLESLQVR